VAYLSKLSLASTSVETYPGINSKILAPNNVQSLSQVNSITVYLSISVNVSKTNSFSFSSSYSSSL